MKPRRKTPESGWIGFGDKYGRDADGCHTFCVRNDVFKAASGSPFEVESSADHRPLRV